MLYKGNMEQISRRGQQEKSAKVYNRKRNYYCNTRCRCITQEEQSAIPAGVFNADEDSDDEDAYLGEQKELQKEMQELLAAKDWINQKAWDVASEALAVSPSSGKTIDLRLDWVIVERKLKEGCGDLAVSDAGDVDEVKVLADEVNEEQVEYLENKALWLCARCEDVGQRNGRKIAEIAEKEKQQVHQIYAIHSHKTAKKCTASAFDGLRGVVNLVRGCKVMLTRNVAYKFGIANGTRGIFISAVYGPGGVGTFPEALICEFPDYCGDHFYKDEPKWVPIVPKVACKDKSKMSRTQFPLVAGFALTVNKVSGLTVKEGVVIHLVGGSHKFKPASKHGLPFVAFTRSESFAMTAFKNIPPWQDFQKGSESDMLKKRLRFIGNPDASAPADTGNGLAAWPSNIYMFSALCVLSEPSEDPT